VIEDRATILERMTKALAGSGDMEVMRALGGAEAAPGRLPAATVRQLRGVVDQGLGGASAIAELGAKLTQLQAVTNQNSYDQARGALAALVARLNSVRRWRLNERNEERVAEAALLMHLQPACPTCRGRRYLAVEGQAAYICQPCGGSGQRPYPRRFKEEISATLNVLGLIQGLAERAVARRMA
jgi:hypothetical protein